jgi:hypothetical protein
MSSNTDDVLANCPACRFQIAADLIDFNSHQDSLLDEIQHLQTLITPCTRFNFRQILQNADLSDQIAEHEKTFNLNVLHFESLISVCYHHKSLLHDNIVLPVVDEAEDLYIYPVCDCQVEADWT